MTSDSIAAEIFLEIGEPCSPKPVAISYWIRTNLGQLNSLLCVCYVIPATGNTAIVKTNGCSITESEKVILKQLYIVKYYNTLLTTSLGAASTDSVIEYTSDGGTVRRVNKNELSKTYLDLKKSAQDELKALIIAYNACMNIPLGIVGDDFIAAVGTICDDPRRGY